MLTVGKCSSIRNLAYSEIHVPFLQNHFSPYCYFYSHSFFLLWKVVAHIEENHLEGMSRRKSLL